MFYVCICMSHNVHTEYFFYSREQRSLALFPHPHPSFVTSLPSQRLLVMAEAVATADAPTTAAQTGIVSAAPAAPPPHGAPAAGTPPVPAIDDGVVSPKTGNMNQVLEANFLGVHKLKVKQIKHTEYTRQLSKVGVKAVKESLEARGWISANAPYVLVPRESLPEGKETVWSSDVLSSLQVFCLDGNHRLAALSQLFGDEFELDVRLYLHFDDDLMVNALARSK